MCGCFFRVLFAIPAGCILAGCLGLGIMFLAEQCSPKHPQHRQHRAIKAGLHLEWPGR